MRTLLSLLLLTLAIPAIGLAHSGGTDGADGHHCRTDCEKYGLEYNEYHFHDAEDNSIQTYERNAAIFDRGMAERLHGNILLQVEENGEAWYVDPVKCRAIYMKNGAAAYEIMRFLGLGINNTNIKKIPIGVHEFTGL